jgi:hypothetical protein
MSRQMFRHVSRLYRSMSPLWFLSVHMLSLISINKQNPDMLAERRQKEIEAATVVNQVSLAVASHIIEWIDMANLQADLYLPLEQLIKVASPAFGHVPVPPSSLVASLSLPRPYSSVSSSSSSLPNSSQPYCSASFDQQIETTATPNIDADITQVKARMKKSLRAARTQLLRLNPLSEGTYISSLEI